MALRARRCCEVLQSAPAAATFPFRRALQKSSMPFLRIFMRLTPSLTNCQARRSVFIWSAFFPPTIRVCNSTAGADTTIPAIPRIEDFMKHHLKDASPLSTVALCTALFCALPLTLAAENRAQEQGTIVRMRNDRLPRLAACVYGRALWLQSGQRRTLPGVCAGHQ